MEREDDFFGGVLKIGLGIALGAFLVWMAAEYYMRYRIKQAAEVIQTVVDDASEEMRAAQVRATERQAAFRRQQEEQRRRDAQARAAAIQASAGRQRTIRAAEAAKAAAWAAFYQPSAQCLNEASVECGNQHMRARREFERRYAAGEL